MSGMFSSCESLTSLNLAHFDTHKVYDMSSMFSHCTSLSYLNIDNFNTSLVNNMAMMFMVDSNLESLDISKFDMDNCDFFNLMFDGCFNLVLTLNKQKSQNLLYWLPGYVTVIDVSNILY